MMRNALIVAAITCLLAACNGSIEDVEKTAETLEAMPGATEMPASPSAKAEAAVAEPKGELKTEVTEKTEAQLNRELKTEIDKLLAELGEGYIAGVEGPFIVLGNIPEERFKRFMRDTIRACSRCMNKQYFDKKPDYKIKIYLFGDDASYRKMAKKLWNDTDVSHFGYYKPSSHTMVMNISTGGGTLVHEMFHALVDPDFPDIPTWLNEGIASLYECCRIGEDRLEGGMNWRFPRLQQALRDGELVTLKSLAFTSQRQFYGRNSDLHYAEARYFCMYMQEKGLLERLYKKFRDDFDSDPTGKKFVEEVFEKKIEEVERDWIDWVKTQKYER